MRFRRTNVDATTFLGVAERRSSHRPTRLRTPKPLSSTRLQPSGDQVSASFSKVIRPL